MLAHQGRQVALLRDLQSAEHARHLVVALRRAVFKPVRNPITNWDRNDSSVDQGNSDAPGIH